MARKPGRIWNTNLDVIGMGFRLKKGTRQTLADLIDKKGEIRGIRIVREPDNPYDPNALAVYLPERVMSGTKLGYLRRQAAELLAPKIDSGYLTIKRVELVKLYSDDDNKSGQLYLVLQDNPLKPSHAKPLTKR